MPTLISRTRFGFTAFLSARAAMIPMIKQPITLIRKVFTGNPFSGFIGSSPIRYLPIAPIAPPAPTIRHLIIVIILTFQTIPDQLIILLIVEFSFLLLTPAVTIITDCNHFICNFFC